MITVAQGPNIHLSGDIITGGHGLMTFGNTHSLYQRIYQISQHDDLLVKSYIIDKYNIEYKLFSINEAINTVAIFHSYDPVREYLDGFVS